MKRSQRRAAQLTLFASWLVCGALTQALEVQYDLCAEVLSAPVCVLRNDGALRVWLDVPVAAAVAFRLERKRLWPAAANSRDGGQLFELQVPPRDGTLSVEISGDARASWSLRLAAPRALELSERANALMSAGDNDAALRFIVGVLPEAAVYERAELLRARGRALGRLGDVAGAQDALRAAMAQARSGDQVYTALRAAGALAFSLVHNGRHLSAARDLLGAFDPGGLGHAPSRYFRSHYLALVAFNDGDARTQLRLFADAARQARRFDWPWREHNSESLLAVQWQRLGQRERAQAVLEGWRDRLPVDLPACERALFWTNLGWSHLLALEAGEPVADPTPVLTRAQAEASVSCGINDQVNAHINLALAHWHAGRHDAAGQALADARALTVSPALHLVFWARDIEARLALSRDDPGAALALYEQLNTLAQATGSPATRWRALVGRAYALEALDRPADALRSYAEAQQQLDADVLQVPLADGRESLLATRERAGARQLALLLHEQRNEEAFALVRQQRTRLIRTAHVAARLAALDGPTRARWDSSITEYRALRESLALQRAESWTLAADALQWMLRDASGKQQALREVLDRAVAALPPAGALVAAPAVQPGELFVTLARTVSSWAAFSWDGTTIDVVQSDCPGEVGAAVATCALAPLASRIAAADAVLIAPPAAMTSVDFHALRIGDRTLVEQARVSYAADLGTAHGSSLAAGRALLVADPHGNLRAARDEVADTETLLRASARWQVNALAGGDADLPRVLARLRNVDLFHFAGHASAGSGGSWDSALLLAADTQMSLGDILTLPAAPSLVVLSGCETAASAGATVPGFSLASAFLAGGAGAVIATSRSVDDASAGALTAAFYSRFVDGAPITHAFHQAQLEMRARSPQHDWSAFRLLLP